MQLGDAVEGWLGAHDHALSPSTRQDIEEIGVAVVVCGHHEVACDALTETLRSEIVAEAEDRTALKAAAIREFLDIVAEWGRQQVRPAPPVDDRLVPSWTDDAGGDAGANTVIHDLPMVDDLDPDDDWADELPSLVDPVHLDEPQAVDAPESVTDEAAAVDDDQPDPTGEPDAANPAEPDDEPDPTGEPDAEAAAVDDDEPDPTGEPDAEAAAVDDDEPEPTGEPDAANPAEPDDEPEPTGEPDAAADRAVAVAVDEDDLDDDELAMIDADLTVTDEHQFDLNELAIIDTDLAALELGAGAGADEPVASRPTARPRPPIAGDPAASSFLQTIGRSAAPSSAFADLSRRADEPVPIPVPSREDAGIFTEAAHYDGHRKSIDWLTVTYFVVAAICFGFVIYFYLSS